MATVKTTDAEFDTTVSKGLVLVDLWAEWCTPCLMIGPALEEISTELEGKITIAKLNVDENPETPNKFGVQGIPTLLLFRDGKLIDRIVGAVPKVTLSEEIAKHITV